MGIRTGAEFIASLRDDRRVFIDGRLVTDVTSHPPLRNAIATMASMFDAQHEPEYRDIMTYVSPATGARVSMTYFPARTLEEYQARLRCDYLRTDLTYGMMGRLTDFMSAFLLDQVAALRAVGKTDAAGRTQRYLDHCRENDVCLTHALIDPQSDRSTPDAPVQATRIVERRRDGVVVSGARLLSTLAPIANECYVGPFYPRKPGEEDFAVVFAMPMSARGLKIIARESYDKGASRFDRPLSGRFDEGDAVLVFDEVFIPDERVMIAGDVEAYNSLIANAPGYVGIQGVARSTAKLRFLTGLCALVGHANGRSKTPRFQELIGELVGYLNLAEGIQQATCIDAMRRMQAAGQGAAAAGPGEPRVPSQVGMAALTLFFPMVNSLAAECLKNVTGSGAIAMTEADYDNPEIRPLVDRLLIGPGIDAKRRLQLMKLVWDATGDQFGARQMLYERYYAGDPARNRQIWFGSPKRGECEDMVKRLLEW